MADQDKGKDPNTGARKKTTGKKAVKKKVVRKKAAPRKKAAKKTVPKKAVSNKPAAKGSPKTAGAAVRKTAAKRAPAASARHTDPRETLAGDSAMWWLNLVLIVVLVAISVLLYVLMEQGALKGMNMDKIWSSLGGSGIPVAEQLILSPDTPAEADVIVIEAIAIDGVTGVEDTGKDAKSPALQPLPEDQQQLLREIFMLSPEHNIE